jgi:hypothetical protein
MINNFQSLEKKVNNLVKETQNAEIEVYNTFNEFLMLSDNQFVENRIADHEIKKVESKEEKIVNTKDEIANNYGEAIKLGIEAIDLCTLPNEEDEELDQLNAKKKVIEPFMSNSLPFVIGTKVKYYFYKKEFFEDDLCGINIQETIDVEEVIQEEKKDEKIEEKTEIAINTETNRIENEEKKENNINIDMIFPGEKEGKFL